MHLVAYGNKLLQALPQVPKREAALQVGCEEGQARDFFSKTRSSVRGFLDRMMRKASGPHGELGAKAEQAHRQLVEPLGPLLGAPAGLASAGGEADHASPDKQAQDRHARLERHRNYLDATGGIGHIEFVGGCAAAGVAARSPLVPIL